MDGKGGLMVGKQLISSGAHGSVYDNGDGTVTKVTNNEAEVELCGWLSDINFKYVANCYDEEDYTYHVIRKEWEIIKEKIDHWVLLPYQLKHLSKHWDDSLLNSQELFDYINEYLKTGDKAFLAYRTPNKFIDYLYTLKSKGHGADMANLFGQLEELVQELKDNDIYNIDFNELNFGYKNDHLALFELGGAKIKQK
jgi:hypothetical protein